MDLIIRIVDGKPYGHPMFKDNLRQAYPTIDLSEFSKFVRVPPPVLGLYEVYEGVTYELRDGVYTDVHHVREKTADEKQAMWDDAKAWWLKKNRPSWTFNEATCDFDPPTPYPTDGKRYIWDESTISWVEVPATQE